MKGEDIIIELFPAGNGDAMLISIGDTRILIDGGYVSTYSNSLRQRLTDIKDAGGKLTYFIVTHIDADHISGAIEFLKENGMANAPNIIPIQDVWFNSYRHLHFDEKKHGSLEEKPSVLLHGGIPSQDADDPSQNVSYFQGSTLGSCLLKGKYQWNNQFNGKAVSVDEPQVIQVQEDLKLTLLGPTRDELDRLAKKWLMDLRKRYQKEINEDTFFDDAFELLTEEIRQTEDESLPQDQELAVAAAHDFVLTYSKDWLAEDNSVTNGSSITFLLEYDGKTLLFLGDSISTPMMTQIKKLPQAATLPMHVDVLKVAHHGSFPNNSPEFHKCVNAEYYLFSTNGQTHHHPHLETIAWILKENATIPKKLVFNYSQDDRLGVMEYDELKSKYMYQTIWPEVAANGTRKEGYVSINLKGNQD